MYSEAVAVIMTVVNLDFQDREDFLFSHKYDRQNSNWMKLNHEGLTRKKIIARYFPHYTVDNLYEHCFFKNFITVINEEFGLEKNHQFTLGHHIPLNKGGAHHVSNWFIQAKKDNQIQGDNLPDCPLMSYEEQIDYLFNHLVNHLTINGMHSERFIKYALKYSGVYNESSL